MKRKSRRENKVRAPGAERLIPFDEVEALIDLLEARGLEEFELERSGVRIRIRRSREAGAGAPILETQAMPANPGRAPAVETPAAPVSARAEAEREPPATETPDDVHVVKSPIVGTFYAGSRPEAAPFVKLGDGVEVGQVLCIIEAMKLMNEIEADVAGEIAGIYVENAQPVEYGEPLFAIRPGKKG